MCCSTSRTWTRFWLAEATSTTSDKQLEIERMCKALRCATTLFSDMLGKIAGVAFSQALKAQLAILDSAATQDTFLKVKAGLTELANAEVDRRGLSRAPGMLDWCGDVVEMRGLDPHAAWSMQYASHVKALLLAKDKAFLRLPWEAWIFPEVPDQVVQWAPYPRMVVWISGVP